MSVLGDSIGSSSFIIRYSTDVGQVDTRRPLVNRTLIIPIWYRLATQHGRELLPALAARLMDSDATAGGYVNRSRLRFCSLLPPILGLSATQLITSTMA